LRGCHKNDHSRRYGYPSLHDCGSENEICKKLEYYEKGTGGQCKTDSSKVLREKYYIER
jgi:hypothetical protein